MTGQEQPELAEPQENRRAAEAALAQAEAAGPSVPELVQIAGVHAWLAVAGELHLIRRLLQKRR